MDKEKMEKIEASMKNLLSKFEQVIDGKVVIDKVAFEEIQAKYKEMTEVNASVATELKTTKEQLDQATASLNKVAAEKIIANTLTSIIKADQDKVIAEKDHAIEIERRKTVLSSMNLGAEKIIAKACRLGTKEDFDEYVLELVEARNMSDEAKNEAERKAMIEEQKKVIGKIETPAFQLSGEPDANKGIAEKFKGLGKEMAKESKEEKAQARQNQVK